ncbi:MAG TPA: M1 family metallopeptidase [Bacillales bacterium]|nr:M1 family metallopeptidase [Bacillales bacterium]
MRFRWMVPIGVSLAILSGCSGGGNGTDENGKNEPGIRETGEPQHEKHEKPMQNQARYGPAKPHYEMKLRYDADKHRISGDMRVQLTNQLNRPLNKIYFNLWPNADVFGEEGGIEISGVKVNGKTADFNVDKTKLEIAGISFPEGERATVAMHFVVHVPEKRDRFGWSDETVSLGNWFPIAAVYDAEGWNLDPYFSGGESFYSLTSDFDVTLTTGSSQVVAATGVLTDQAKKDDGTTTYHYKAENVRDFALEMNPNYKVKAFDVEDIKVNLYYTDEQARYAADMEDVARNALKVYEEKFGEYPWPELDIVTMKGWFGGMEYPQLVMISFNEAFGKDFIMVSVAHEIAHQWFYGAVGNNEYDEPWLDESFATFASLMSLDALGHLNRVEPPGDPYHLTSPVSVFAKRGKDGQHAYANVIYSYGAKTLNELRKKIGDKTFYEAMQTYYEKERLTISTTAEFVETMEAVSGEDLTKFFKAHRVYVKETK